MLEKQIEAKCKKIAERYGCHLVKWVSPGHRGVPDRILLMPGQVVFLEFKQPGKKLSPLQRVWAQRLTDLGHAHAIISDTDTFEGILRSAGLSAGRD